MSVITLTSGQQSAMEEFTSFLADPMEQVFVLEGYSGTGKSTLVKFIIDRLPNLIKTVKLINPIFPDYQVTLTATTNKAAESLSSITGLGVTTIHSELGLVVQKDWETGKTFLVPKTQDQLLGHILFIDEASYVDKQLLNLIFKKTRDCKIVFMGDPAQLTPVKSNNTPVFDAGFPTARLTEIVRQAEGNPIIELSTRFRETVSSGEFFSFTPDGQHIIQLNHAQFEEEVRKEFCRPDWEYQDSKILAWTNNAVVRYNQAIRDMVEGEPNLQPGDYAVCNSYVQAKGMRIKTDQMVLITSVEPAVVYGLSGKMIGIDGKGKLFMPDSLAEKKAALSAATKAKKYEIAHEIESEWVDLRAAYSCTVNKSQGSTFDKVFVDLSDISKCNMGVQIARMLYVAISRARHQVFLVGDFV